MKGNLIVSCFFSIVINDAHLCHLTSRIILYVQRLIAVHKKQRHSAQKAMLLCARGKLFHNMSPATAGKPLFRSRRTHFHENNPFTTESIHVQELHFNWDILRPQSMCNSCYQEWHHNHGPSHHAPNHLPELH